MQGKEAMQVKESIQGMLAMLAPSEQHESEMRAREGHADNGEQGAK
jgi:hypothetical protein